VIPSRHFFDFCGWWLQILFFRFLLGGWFHKPPCVFRLPGLCVEYFFFYNLVFKVWEIGLSVQKKVVLVCKILRDGVHFLMWHLHISYYIIHLKCHENYTPTKKRSSSTIHIYKHLISNSSLKFFIIYAYEFTFKHNFRSPLK
jgi:hypothetical protein